MRGSGVCAYVAFRETECERSVLAREAAKRMNDLLDVGV